MKNKVLIVLPKLSSAGGVSSFWNAILPELLSLENLTVQVLEVGGHGLNIFGALKDQWNLKKKCDKSVDLVILNPSLGKRSFFRDAFFSRQIAKKNVPFVVFFHGWELEFEKKVDKNYIKFFNNSFGLAEKIFVLSDDFRKKIQEWGYKGEVIIETTNVDAALLTNFSIDQKLQEIKSNSKIKILFLARLLREKGVFDTVDVFRILQINYPFLELTIAGDGKDFKELVGYVKNYSNVYILGHVEGQKKIDVYTNHHIYCFPTYYGEGLPTTILEAMAFGMPIITTTSGGLKDFFQDGKMGYFVDSKDHVQLKDKMAILLSNREKLLKMGLYNYRYAHENLLSSVVAQRLYDHIKELFKKT